MYGVQLAMSAPVHDSAGLRLLLQSKLNGKAAGFRDTHLEAMLACGLNSEAKLSSAGWSKLYDQAALPLALVEALLQAYNADALHNSGTPGYTEDACHYMAFGIAQAVALVVAIRQCAGNFCHQEFIFWCMCLQIALRSSPSQLTLSAV